MVRLLLIVFGVALLPQYAIAATEGADMGIYTSGIRFSSPTLKAGETVRLYAKVRNEGDVDILGYVLFYKGTTSIGNSQVVSTPAGGAQEEVWVDFIVPYQQFNIRAEIRGTEPLDINASNNVAVTALYTPFIDDDNDDIADQKDNCPYKTNADQRDTDYDGIGDACDDDSDGDGVSNTNDSEPLNPLVSKVETPAPVIAPSEPVVQIAQVDEPQAPPQTLPDQQHGDTPVSSDSEVTTTTTSSDLPSEITDINLITDDSILENREAQGIVRVSSNATFVYQPLSWKEYRFRVLIPDSSSHLVWDFGDGVVSSLQTVDHTFRKTGKYPVVLTVTNADGTQKTDTQLISISFFHMSNPFIQLIIVALGLLTFSFLILAIQSGRAIRRTKRLEETCDIEGHDHDDEAEEEEEVEEDDETEEESEVESEEEEIAEDDDDDALELSEDDLEEEETESEEMDDDSDNSDEDEDAIEVEEAPKKKAPAKKKTVKAKKK